MSKAILMVIAPVDFRDEEFFEPYNTFQAEGYTVTVGSTQVGTATGMLGGTFEVSETLEGKSANNYDALVVVGGFGSPTHLWDNAELHGLVQAFDQQKKIVSAICVSGVVLAKAGILKGKTATVWEMPESLAAYEAGGVNYVKEDVMVDGRIITSNGPHAATPFAHAIGKQLAAVAAN